MNKQLLSGLLLTAACTFAAPAFAGPDCTEEPQDKWMSVIANFGVIAGIVFLGFQIGLEREATTANTTQMRAESARDSYLTVASADALAPILAKMTGSEVLGAAAKRSVPPSVACPLPSAARAASS